MNEEKNTELLEEGYNEFWDPENISEEEEPAELEAESEGADCEPEADQQTEEREREQAETEAVEVRKEETDQSFTLKHLDETRTVSREEVVALAQKGLDYDRIRVKYDELKTKGTVENESAKTAFDFVERLAKENGMSSQDFMDNTAASLRAKAQGIDFQTALKAVQLERREREIEAKEARISESEKVKAEEAEKENAAKAKRESDIKDFLESHKDSPVDVKSIPQSVWTDVAEGMTLNAAYMKYENQMLKAQLAKKESAEKQKEQKEKNKARSTGSQSTKGNTDRESSDWWYESDE